MVNNRALLRMRAACSTLSEPAKPQYGFAGPLTIFCSEKPALYTRRTIPSTHESIPKYRQGETSLTDISEEFAGAATMEYAKNDFKKFDKVASQCSSRGPHIPFYF